MKIEEYDFAYNLLPKNTTWKVVSVSLDCPRQVHICNENNMMQIKFFFSYSEKPRNKYRITECVFRELKEGDDPSKVNWSYADFRRDNLAVDRCKTFLEKTQATSGPCFYSKENRYFLKSQRKAANETSKKLRSQTLQSDDGIHDLLPCASECS